MVGSGFPVALHPRVMGSFLATVMLIGSSTIRGNDPTEMIAAADVESDLTAKQNKTKYKLCLIRKIITNINYGLFGKQTKKVLYRYCCLEIVFM
jgi:hypothetical protein